MIQKPETEVGNLAGRTLMPVRGDAVIIGGAADP